MADKAAELMVEVTARIEKLEAGLKNAEAKVHQSAQRMDKSMSKGPAAGMAKLAIAAAKVGIALEAIRLSMVGFQAAVHGTTAAFGLLSGDSEKFFKSMEKLDTQITKIPILGAMLSGTADEIVNALALFSPQIQKMEELEKIAAKNKKGRSARSGTIEILRSNELLKEQIAIAEELDDKKQQSLKFDLQRSTLAEQHRKTVNQLVQDVGRQSKEGKNAVRVADEQLALQLQLVDAEEIRVKQLRAAVAEEQRIAELKAIQEEQAAKAAQAAGMAGSAKDRIALLELEERIVVQVNDEKKRKLQLELELLQIKQRELDAEKEIKAQGFSAEDQANLLKLLSEEHGRLRMIARERHRIAEAERKAAEAAEKHNDALQKQLENSKKLLQDQLGKDRERQKEIDGRLGMASKNAASKQGFTQSGNTAMGTFTFAEKGSEAAIKDLAKENVGIQKRIDTTLKSIEQITRTLANKVGFK